MSHVRQATKMRYLLRTTSRYQELKMKPGIDKSKIGLNKRQGRKELKFKRDEYGGITHWYWEEMPMDHDRINEYLEQRVALEPDFKLGPPSFEVNVDAIIRTLRYKDDPFVACVSLSGLELLEQSGSQCQKDLIESRLFNAMQTAKNHYGLPRLEPKPSEPVDEEGS